jgi:hypothetical protein
MSDYITEQELLDYMKSGADLGNSVTQGAITAASRQVESFTGRIFYQRAATSLYYSSYSTAAVTLEIDDLATTTDLAVRTDTAGDGTYSTLLTINTDFLVEPRNQQFGGQVAWPYTQLRARALLKFPTRLYAWQPDTVKVTGTFGWAAVPADIKQATKIIAAQFVKLADAPLGVAGWGAYGDIRVRDIPQASTLLAPYRKGSSFGIA